MTLEVTRYTSGRIAVANLCTVIEALERRRADPTFDQLTELSRLLFIRGDLLGRITDHDRAESTALQAVAIAPDDPSAMLVRAMLSLRFHRFDEAGAMIQRALKAGCAPERVDPERAALLQATGRYPEAFLLRQRLAELDPGIQTMGSLASLEAEMGQWREAQASYTLALNLDRSASPLPCAQLLFEWGVNAMRHGDLERAEATLATLELILPAHVPGRGHRAEVALERGHLDRAEALITPLIDADDPEYRATYAQILAARGEHAMAAREAERAALAYEALIARRPEAYADHAATFFLGLGNRPQRAVALAAENWRLRDTPRARRLLSRAHRAARAWRSTRGAA